MNYYRLFLRDVNKKGYIFKKGKEYLVSFSDRKNESLKNENNEVWFKYDELKDITDLIKN